MSAAGIRAGRAFVELGTQDNKLVAGLNRASARVKGWGRGISAIGAGLTGLIPTALLKGGLSLFTQMGSDLNDMAARTQFSVEALGELGHAAEQSGSSMDDIEKGSKGMKSFLVAAQQAGPARRLLADLNLPLDELAQMAPEDQMVALGNAIAAIKDPAQKFEAFKDVFGAKNKLSGMFAEGPAALSAFRAEAIALGRPTKESVELSDKLGDALGALSRVGKNTVFTIGGQLAPMLIRGAKLFQQIAVVTRAWIADHPILAQGLFALLGGLIALSAGLLIAKGLFMGLGAALGIAAAGIKIIIALVGFLISPLGLIVAGLALLTAWFLTSTQTGADLLQWLGGHFTGLKDIAVTAFGGIADALAAGDIALAGKILWAALKAGWQQVLLFLMEGWQNFKGFFLGIGQSLAFGFLNVVNNAFAGVQVAWVETVSFLGNLWDILMGALRKGWNHFAGFFGKVWAKIKGLFGDEDAQAEVDRINAEVAAKDNEIEAERDQSIAERESRRQARRDEIEADRAAAAEGLALEQEAEKAKLEAGKKAALSPLEKDLADAKAELDQFRAEAAAKRAGGEAAAAQAEAARKKVTFPGGSDGLAKQAKLDVAGTFSAAVAGRIGSGNVAERQLNAAEQSNKYLKDIKEYTKEGVTVAP